MSRSSSVSAPRRDLYVVPERRGSLELEDLVVPPVRDQPREYDSWPCDSFFLLPDSVLACDATAFRQDLMSLDPVLSASLPDWDLPSLSSRESPMIAGRHTRIQYPGGLHGDPPYRTRSLSTSRVPASQRPERRSITLLDHHEGLTVHTAGQGTVMIGGGGDGRGGESSGGAGGGSPAANGNSPQQQQQSPAGRRNSSQKDAYWFAHGGNPTNSTSAKPHHMPSLGGGPNELFFGQEDRSSGLSYKDREDRARQLRDRQDHEKQQKLQELKDQAAAAQRFREQQESERRRRLEDMRQRDADRRTQVEERKRIIQQAEQDRREAVIRKNMVGQDNFQIERDSRLDAKRRNERSNIVFAFGSSTPRMLDPRDSATSFWGTRRATSTTNVHLADTSSASHRRSSDVVDTDLSRKRATSAHSLDRKSEGEDLMSKSMTAAIPSAARRRTDLVPTLPSMRDSFGSSNKNSPRHRSPGMRSGTVTPNSPSRPASAMSGTSGVSSQVSLRPRTSPRKPRPLSIAGSTLTSADKPKDSSRESRPTERKSSVGSLSHKPTRAKSAGSDRSGPTTPARTPNNSATTPSKRTTPQAKTESSTRKSDTASRKVSLGSKPTPKAKTPRTTPLQSPAVESKPLPGTNDKKTSIGKEPKSDTVNTDNVSQDNTKGNSDASVEAEAMNDVEDTPEADGNCTESIEIGFQTQNIVESEEKTQQNFIISDSTDQSMEELPKTEETICNEEESENKFEEMDEEKSEEPEKTLAQKAAEKPVTGYATEEEYRAALAEKRRLVREEKERQAELERQRIHEEEEKEKREEEEYLRLMDEQRKAEDERLQKAIEAAQKEREDEAKRKEEDEKQRIEAEKIELQKQLENEERLRKEEEERQARKSRVAAIMARTRGKGGASTPNKNESKTPSEESKAFGDGGAMSQSMTDSMIGLMTSSMTGSLIAEATNNEQNESSFQPTSDVSSQPTSGISSQPPSDVSSQPTSDNVSSQPLSDVSTQPEVNNMEDIVGGVASMKVSEQLQQQPHINGDSPVMPMDTTPTQQIDLLENISHVNTVNHNGVDNTSSNNAQNVQSNIVVDVPLSSTISGSSDAGNFEQIIDLSQTKLSNEDAVNSNPTTPFIAFEQNLNKKQSQDNTSTVPDLLM